MSEICEHGIALAASSLEGVIWAGGVGFCLCHNASFGYIDSYSSGPRGSRRKSMDQNLCEPCGGQVTITLKGSGGYHQGRPNSDGGFDNFYYQWWTDDDGVVHEETTSVADWNETPPIHGEPDPPVFYCKACNAFLDDAKRHADALGHGDHLHVSNDNGAKWRAWKPVGHDA